MKFKKLLAKAVATTGILGLSAFSFAGLVGAQDADNNRQGPGGGNPQMNQNQDGRGDMRGDNFRNMDRGDRDWDRDRFDRDGRRFDRDGRRFFDRDRFDRGHRGHRDFRRFDRNDFRRFGNFNIYWLNFHNNDWESYWIWLYYNNYPLWLYYYNLIYGNTVYGYNYFRW